MTSGSPKPPSRDAAAGRVRLRRAPGGRLEARRAAELLIRRHGAALLATARRYTSSPEDAEDAYQRALEILLTRAPTVEEDELLPWTRTVIRHEAFAIWRSRAPLAVPPDEEQLEQAPSAAPPPEEQVQTYERLRVGAEAIARLKPQEVRCLLLRAEGYSYRQISEVTGWTYTKVNRCLTEGRRSFLRRVAGIESGAECERLTPLLSALADGEASATEMATLRPHLRSCLACRATLRAYREVPHRAAEVIPVAGAGATEDLPPTLVRWVDSAVMWAQERAAIIGAKAQGAAEAAGATKVAAVTASAAALAGGTLAVGTLKGGEAGKPGAPPRDRAERALERAAPANLLPSIPDDPSPVVVVEPPAAPPLPEAPPEPPPLPAPAPIAAIPPAPPAPVEEPSEPLPTGEPIRATIPITNRGESALPGVDEEEREIAPVMEPIDPPTREEPSRGGTR